MNILLRSGGGGLGKMICFTAVLKSLRQKHQDNKIHTMTNFPEVFVNNPDVDKFYQYPQENTLISDFYDYHVDFQIEEVIDPYFDLEYRQGKIHLIDAWHNKHKLPIPSEKRGYIYLTEIEKKWADNMIQQFNLGKTKFVCVQFTGGTPYSKAELAFDITRPKQVRDLPVEIAQEVVDTLNKKGIICLQLSLPTEPQLKNTLKLPIPQNQIMDPRFIFAIMDRSNGFCGIDSFGQHAWVALGKKNGTVLFGATHPKNLGYTVNTNLENNVCRSPHCNRPEGCLLDIIGNGKPWQCPTGNCMKFKSNDIVKVVLENLEKGV